MNYFLLAGYGTPFPTFVAEYTPSGSGVFLALRNDIAKAFLWEFLQASRFCFSRTRPCSFCLLFNSSFSFESLCRAVPGSNRLFNLWAFDGSCSGMVLGFFHLQVTFLQCSSTTFICRGTSSAGGEFFVVLNGLSCSCFSPITLPEWHSTIPCLY